MRIDFLIWVCYIRTAVTIQIPSVHSHSYRLGLYSSMGMKKWYPNSYEVLPLAQIFQQFYHLLSVGKGALIDCFFIPSGEAVFSDKFLYIIDIGK